MALTKRQKEVLDYLVSFETKHGYAPSFEEIGKERWRSAPLSLLTYLRTGMGMGQ